MEIVNGTSKRRRKYDDQVQLDTIEVANLRVRNPADTFDYDLVPAAITADRQLNLPLIAATQTLLDNSRGLTLAGENNTEATSTSTSAGDRVTVTGLSIPATSVVIVVAAYRKTTGAATAVAVGLKVNATVVQEASTSASPRTAAINEAESGVAIWILGPRVTNHLGGGVSVYGRRASTVGSGTDAFSADVPNATITDIIIRGVSGDVAVTHGIDEVRVFVLPTVAP